MERSGKVSQSGPGGLESKFTLEETTTIQYDLFWGRGRMENWGLLGGAPYPPATGEERTGKVRAMP